MNYKDCILERIKSNYRDCISSRSYKNKWIYQYNNYTDKQFGDEGKKLYYVNTSVFLD